MLFEMVPFTIIVWFATNRDEPVLTVVATREEQFPLMVKVALKTLLLIWTTLLLLI